MSEASEGPTTESQSGSQPRPEPKRTVLPHQDAEDVRNRVNQELALDDTMPADDRMSPIVTQEINPSNTSIINVTTDKRRTKKLINKD